MESAALHISKKKLTSALHVCCSLLVAIINCKCVSDIELQLIIKLVFLKKRMTPLCYVPRLQGSCSTLWLVMELISPQVAYHFHLETIDCYNCIFVQVKRMQKLR